ncbi:cytochrome P450 [Trametopsis cervina]|nr:cytochrome P450 [Trametopsis cervina]
MAYLAISTALLAFLLWRARLYLRLIKTFNYATTPVLIAPTSLLGALIPTTWWNPGLGWTWEWRHTNYKSHTLPLAWLVPLLSGTPALYVGSHHTMQSLLLTHEPQMSKADEMQTAITVWGPNILSTSGSAWRRHRRAVGPAFAAPDTHRLVVAQTCALYDEMVSALGWREREEIIVEDMNKIMLKFALTIICRCGFGIPMPWSEEGSSYDDEDAEGAMGLPEALERVSESLLLRLALPAWVYRLPVRRLRRIDTAWRTTRRTLELLVADKRASTIDDGTAATQADVLTRLVQALDDGEGDEGVEGAAGEGVKAGGERGKHALSTDEVIGNAFVLMFAGHETTARTLAGTFAHLALHQDAQDAAVAEIERVLDGGREITLDDVNKLEHVLACFHETSRIYPGAMLLSRKAQVPLDLPLNPGSTDTVRVPPGTTLVFDMIGIHHDPAAFPSPSSFLPSRWLSPSASSPTSSSTPTLTTTSSFGLGPRACVGRRFTQAEAVSLLATFLREWRVDVVLEPGETREGWAERVLGRRCDFSLGFGVGRVPVRIERRVR